MTTRFSHASAQVHASSPSRGIPREWRFKLPARLRLKRVLPLSDKAPRAARILRKRVARLFMRPPRDTRLLFIMGCQRSGTTMLTHVLEKDPDINVYGEYSCLSAEDREEGLRLNDVADVKRRLEKSKYSLMVGKPLVESQNGARLLAELPQLKIVWLFRHFSDVAASDLRLFGVRNGFDNLRPIYERDEVNWRAENVSAETYEIVREAFSRKMSAYDAAALFWYVRNVLFFEQGLDQAWSSVLLMRYEDLVNDPGEYVRRLYQFVGARRGPRPEMVDAVHRKSIGKSAHIPLSNDVRALCTGLYDKLIAALASERTLKTCRDPNAVTGQRALVSGLTHLR